MNKLRIVTFKARPEQIYMLDELVDMLRKRGLDVTRSMLIRCGLWALTRDPVFYELGCADVAEELERMNGGGERGERGHGAKTIRL